MILILDRRFLAAGQDASLDLAQRRLRVSREQLGERGVSRLALPQQAEPKPTIRRLSIAMVATMPVPASATSDCTGIEEVRLHGAADFTCDGITGHNGVSHGVATP
jgi:hypothetical protein